MRLLEFDGSRDVLPISAAGALAEFRMGNSRLATHSQRVIKHAVLKRNMIARRHGSVAGPPKSSRLARAKIQASTTGIIFQADLLTVDWSDCGKKFRLFSKPFLPELVPIE
jgi:hypothetical protein